MALTVSHLLPGETAGWTLKFYNLAGTQVGTSGGTAGVYSFAAVAGTARYISESVPFGAEPGAIAAGDHIIQAYAPGSTDPDIAAITTLVDGVDNPLTSTNAGLDGAQFRAAIGLEAANLNILVNGIAGKNTVVNNGDGTYNITIRNAADTADLRVVQFNPTTGAKTVV